MRLLLDTHALLWWSEGHVRLSAPARRAIGDAENEVLVSAVSAMEITTKFRLGKLAGVQRMAEHFEEETAAEGFQQLPITLRHAQLAGNLSIPHKDPFDRLLIAQSILENLNLVSNEESFDAFGVARLW